MSLFVRLTLIGAAVIVGLFVLTILLKALFVAAIVAGFAIAGVYLYGQIRRRLEPTAAIVRTGRPNA